MSGLYEAATAIMSASERRLEIAAQNIANITTPGYKRQVSYAEIMSGRTVGETPPPSIATHVATAQGKLSATGNPLDLAISGAGFFQLRTADGLGYSRAGSFRRTDDGTLSSATGGTLQQVGGGDLIVDSGAVEIAQDGTVIQGGRPIGRIAIFAPVDPGAMTASGGSSFAASEDAMLGVDEGVVRQGMIEASNVSVGDEMVSVMAASRQAETGARLIQMYDELMGRALTTLGQSGR